MVSRNNLPETGSQELNYNEKLLELKELIHFFEEKKRKTERDIQNLQQAVSEQQQFEFQLDLLASIEIQARLSQVVSELNYYYSNFTAPMLDKYGANSPYPIILDHLVEKTTEAKEICESSNLVSFYKAKLIYANDDLVESKKESIQKSWHKELKSQLYGPRYVYKDSAATGAIAGGFLGGMFGSLAGFSAGIIIGGVALVAGAITVGSMFTCGGVGAAALLLVGAIFTGAMMYKGIKKGHHLHDEKKQVIKNFEKEENHPFAKKSLSTLFSTLGIFKANKDNYLQKSPVKPIPTQAFDDYFNDSTPLMTAKM